VCTLAGGMGWGGEGGFTFFPQDAGAGPDLLELSLALFSLAALGYFLWLLECSYHSQFLPHV
jgi:hypothetical protein